MGPIIATKGRRNAVIFHKPAFPGGLYNLMDWAKQEKKRRKKKRKRIRRNRDEALSNDLSWTSSMKDVKNAAKQNQNFKEEEPLDVIVLDNHSNGWACRICTFLNGQADSYCLMCDTEK